MSDIRMLTDKIRGRFVVFDGPDGAGKSTQRRVLAGALEACGGQVVSCRDPGGTAVGDRIRSVLLDHDLSVMNVNCEALLFMASRAQLVAEVVRPALSAGKTVLCDRFVSSTCAYQGAAGHDPKRAVELAAYAIGDCWPDATVLLDVDVEAGFARIGRRPHHAGKNRRRDAGEAPLFDGSRPDAMEARSIDFHRRVRDIFLALHEIYPTPVMTIDGRGDVNAVHRRIIEELSRVAL